MRNLKPTFLKVALYEKLLLMVQGHTAARYPTLKVLQYFEYFKIKKIFRLYVKFYVQRNERRDIKKQI